MIERLILENFRGFDRHEVPLRPVTVMVGGNNAGKSTVVEAVRLLSLVTDRFRRRTGRFVSPPDWLTHEEAAVGLAPAIRGMPSDGFESTVFHRYGDPPAILRAQFSSGAEVVAFVGPDAQVHGIAKRPGGGLINADTVSAEHGLEAIAVQPQVAPLLREEPRWQEETIRRGDGTYLAPQHFRNQLIQFDEHYQAFTEMAERTWPGLQISDLESDVAHPKRPIQLRVRDTNFVGEVSLMGHGLQMWLQIMWFLARAPRDGTVVLDEPDVYMHPDLQRRLLSLVRQEFRQLIIATHSIEIISDVDPGSILSVDRHQAESSFVTSLPGLQGVLDGIGSMQNLQVARLMRSPSFYLVEGKDVRFLRILQTRFDAAENPIDLVPNARLGGRGGWGSGVPRRLPTTNGEGGKIKSFAILDRDYYPDEELLERYAEARSWGIQLHIWSRKEIENFLLVPNAICRHIAGQSSESRVPGAAEVASKIDEIVEEMKDQICDSMAVLLLARDKSGGLPKAMRSARQTLAKSWETQTGRWSVACGKDVISQLSEWSKTNFGVSFGPEALARALQADEVDTELQEVVRAIGEARNYKGSCRMPS